MAISRVIFVNVSRMKAHTVPGAAGMEVRTVPTSAFVSLVQTSKTTGHAEGLGKQICIFMCWPLECRKRAKKMQTGASMDSERRKSNILQIPGGKGRRGPGK